MPHSQVDHAASKMRTILLVDDDADVRNVLKMRLDYKGYSVIESETGNQALDLLRSMHPDVLVLDSNLPGISGLELLRSLHGDPCMCDVTVIVVTGIDLCLVKKELQNLGVFASFAKPFNPGDVLQAIEEALLLHP